MGPWDAKITLVTGAGRSVVLGISNWRKPASQSRSTICMKNARKTAVTQIDAHGGRLTAAPLTSPTMDSVRAGIGRI